MQGQSGHAECVRRIGLSVLAGAIILDWAARPERAEAAPEIAPMVTLADGSKAQEGAKEQDGKWVLPDGTITYHVKPAQAAGGRFRDARPWQQLERHVLLRGHLRLSESAFSRRRQRKSPRCQAARPQTRAGAGVREEMPRLRDRSGLSASLRTHGRAVTAKALNGYADADSA